MTNRLNDQGWRVFRIDMRAAGAGVRLARRFYNAACSDDVRVVVENLTVAFPDTPIVVVGFSLGGSIVLRFAGEVGDRPMPSLRAVAAIAPPIDLVRCSNLIARHPLYDAFFVHHLTTQVAEHQNHFPELPRVVFPRRMICGNSTTFTTAPRWGYADAFDYYSKASALPYIAAIQVPTFILTGATIHSSRWSPSRSYRCRPPSKCKLQRTAAISASSAPTAPAASAGPKPNS